MPHRYIYIYIYTPLASTIYSLDPFSPNLLPSFPLLSFPPPPPIRYDSTAKLYTRVTTTLHGERSIEGTTLPLPSSPNFVSSRLDRGHPDCSDRSARMDKLLLVLFSFPLPPTTNQRGNLSSNFWTRSSDRSARGTQIGRTFHSQLDFFPTRLRSPIFFFPPSSLLFADVQRMGDRHTVSGGRPGLLQIAAHFGQPRE